MTLDPTNHMENLHVKTINAIEAQLKTFDYFRGEHSKLDLLLCNMEAIMNKYRQDFAKLEVDVLRTISYADDEDCHQKKKRKLSRSVIEGSNTVTVVTTKPQEQDSYVNQIQSGNINEDEVQTLIDHPMFTVELVMLKILNYLPFYDLKLCREVNSYFKLFTDQVISKRRLTAVKFVYNPDKNIYVCNSLVGNSLIKEKDDFTLSTFTELFENQPGFPCEIFEFRNGTLCSPDLQDFLAICGKRVRELLLHVFDASSDQKVKGGNNDPMAMATVGLYPTVNLLKNLLLHQVPNLQLLSLQYCPDQWKKSEYFNQLFPEPQYKEVKLPRLKMLHVDETVPEPIIDRLLKVCINLQAFDTEDENFFHLLRTNKFYLLEDFMFNSDPTDLQLNDINFSLISHLINLDWAPDLSEWASALVWSPKLLQILHEILQASSATLKQINWHTPVGFLRGLKIPVMPELKTIHITTANPELQVFEQLTKQQFPSNFDFSSLFPNLKTVQINVNQSSGDEKWEEYFDNNYTPVLTVQTLILAHGRITNKWIQNFALLFPNIRTLKIKSGNFHPSEAAQFGLWSFYQLNFLAMEIDLDDHLNTCNSLDSAFTGFSLDTCSELQKSTCNYDAATLELDGLREFSSIVNLKNIGMQVKHCNGWINNLVGLTTLKLKFVDYSDEIRLNYPPILTHVTGLFAFQMCPKLKVIASGSLRNLGNSQGLINAFSALDDYM